MPNVSTDFSSMTDAEKGALAVDAATGLLIVARAEKAGIVWLCLEDGSEVVRDADGNPATWPE